MKKVVKNKGITLVALVITIIIVLIFAGITISQLTGSGLFENAKLAEQKSKEAQEKENKILDEYESLIDGSYRENKSYNSNIYDEWTTWLYIAGIENPESYNEKDILSDETLVRKLINNENAVDYMLKSKYFIMPAVLNSEKAMTILGESSAEIKTKLINSQEFCKQVANSNYRKNFSEYIVYNADTAIGTAGGRTYYKNNDSFALAGAFYKSGAIFMLVGKNEDDVKGYCSYDPSYKVWATMNNFEYEGEIWYYCQIPYGFMDGVKVTSTTNSKYVGNFQNDEDVAKYILDDFFNKEGVE